MKRIYTLLSLAALAGSAMAVPTVDWSKVQLTPEGSAALQKTVMQQKAMLDNGQLPENSYTRAWIDSNGTEWRSVFAYSEADGIYRWCDGLEYQGEDGQMHQYSWEELPYYVVLYYLQGYPAGGGGYTYSAVVPLSWPCKYMWQQIIDATEEIPADKIDYSLVSPSEMAENADRYCSTFTYQGNYCGGRLNETGTNWSTFFICPPEWVGSQSMIVYNNNASTLANGSTFTLESYDSEEMTYEINNAFVLTDSNNTSRTYRMNVPFNGTARVMGFDPLHFTFNIGEVHVFDLGITGSDILEEKDEIDDYDYLWGPLRKYCITALDKNLTLVIPQTMTSFDRNALGYAWAPDADPNISSSDALNFIMGMMYSPETATVPEGTWNMLVPEETVDPWSGLPTLAIKPEAYSLIPWGYNSAMFPWTDNDGMELIWNTYYNMINSKLGCSLTLGKGLEFHATDTYENTYKIAYQGDYFYHNDPSDWSKYEVRSTGDLDGVSIVGKEAGFTVSAADGQIAVAAAEAANVAVYDLTGACVANKAAAAGETVVVPASKGIYVVKVGNEAKKVIL